MPPTVMTCQVRLASHLAYAVFYTPIYAKDFFLNDDKCKQFKQNLFSDFRLKFLRLADSLLKKFHFLFFLRFSSLHYSAIFVMAHQTILKKTHKDSEELQRQQFPSHIISECLGLLNSQLQETRACYFSQKLFQIFFRFYAEVQ